MSEKDDVIIQEAAEPSARVGVTKPKLPPEPKKREPRVKSGIHEPLEEAANEWIYNSLKDVTSREEKSDILTPWKEKNRKSREILSRTGHPIDGALRRGLFHRAYNPVQTHLNSYDGPTRPVKMDADWSDEHGGNDFRPSTQMKTVFGVERED